MPCRRGEIVLVLFPNSDLRTAKRRPTLVVQADDLGTGLPQSVVAMITSNMARAGHRSRVTVALRSSAGQQSGLLTDSVIMTDNIATILDSEVDRLIGDWPAMSTVDEALAHTLGLTSPPAPGGEGNPS